MHQIQGEKKMNEVLGGSKLNYRLLLISIIVSCCMLATIATAIPDTSNVVLTIDNPGIVPGENEYHITFHEAVGMSAGINGFFVTLDPNTTVDEGIDPSCILVSVNGGPSYPVTDLRAIIHNPDPGYSQYNFTAGTTSLKFATPIDVQFNSDVRIDIVCGLENECPCPPNGYMVWVNHEPETNPTPSNSVQLQVEIDASAGDNGSIDPEGIDLYDCGETPVYTICPDAPCYEIASVLVDGSPVNVTPIGEGCGTYTFAPLNCSHTIEASFRILTSEIDFSVLNNTGGKIISQYSGYYAPPDQMDEIDCSDDACYNITPDPVYYIKNVWVDGSSIPIPDIMGFTYCFENVTEDHTIAGGLVAEFEKIPNVFLFLKYQQPLRLCQGVVEVGPVFNSDTITPVVEYADSIYLGGNSSSFDINGTTTATTFGTYSAGVYTNISSSATADSLTINLLSAPSVRPETYKFTYTDGSMTKYATLVILPDGTMFWGAAAPADVIAISNVEAQMPAWEPVTQAYLDANPDFEGLIGAVIYVNGGTYPETFEVDTPALHLKNLTADHPVIDANGLPTVGSGPTASAVFLSAGCTGIEGFSVINSAANGIAVYPSSQKCSSAMINDAVLGDSVKVPCSIGRVNIVDNAIFDNDDNGIRALECVVLINGNSIYDNTDDGIDADYLYTGVECIDPEAITHSPTAASEIIYNNIYGNGPSGQGVWEVWDPVTETWRFTSNPTECGTLPGWTDSGIQIRHTAPGYPQIDQIIYIVHNYIHENEHAGIFLWDAATDGSSYQIEHNAIIDNGIFGISTRAEVPALIDCKYNDIVGNKYWGIKNWVPEMLIAKENYWGIRGESDLYIASGGPDKGPAPIIELISPCYSHEADQRSDALGNGDNVSHYVEYNPWLYIPAERIFHDVNDPMWMVRAYGSDSLQLQKGWNTFSVPTILYSEADQQSEIMALGDFLTDDNFEWMISWNATSGHWTQLVYGDQIVPCQGYYMKMKEASKFPVLYGSVSPGLPSYHLVQGWNLIGAPWGIDREENVPPLDEGRWAVASPDNDDPEAFMPVIEALESIKEGSGGTKGVAIIISPSVPGQYDIWSASVTSGFWQITNTQEMATGDAYWVYMVNPATYAGFEITPFYLTT
jgi:hypothetical protein